MTPATLALITAVGPPDCATNKFPASSAIVFKRFFHGRPAFNGSTMSEIRLNRADTLPTGNSAVKRKSRRGSRRKFQGPSSKEISSSKLQITPPTVAGPFLEFWELRLI